MKKIPLVGMLDYKTKKIATAVAVIFFIIGLVIRLTPYSEGFWTRFVDYNFLITLLLIAGCKEKVDDERTSLIRNLTFKFSYGILLMSLMIAYLLKVTINPFYLSIASFAIYYSLFYSLEYQNPDLLFIKEGTEINKKHYFKFVLIITAISAIVGVLVGFLMSYYNIGEEFMSRFAF